MEKEAQEFGIRFLIKKLPLGEHSSNMVTLINSA
jgi:hypothetical protein